MKDFYKNYLLFFLWLSIVIFSGMTRIAYSQDIRCAAYAQTAIKQAEQNITYGCGFGGSRWRSDYNSHYNWCMQVSVEQAREETIERIRLLQNCGRVPNPAGIVPISISLKRIECLDDTDDAGEDEIYVLCTAVNLGPHAMRTNVRTDLGVIGVDTSALSPNVETTLYGKFDINENETVSLVPIDNFSRLPTPDLLRLHQGLFRVLQLPFWGPMHEPIISPNPDAIILMVSMMENDDGNPESARAMVKSQAVASMAGSLGLDRNTRAQKLRDDIYSILATPTGFPDTDERIDTKELRLSFEDLLPLGLGTVEKTLYFEGDGGKFNLVFEINQ